MENYHLCTVHLSSRMFGVLQTSDLVPWPETRAIWFQSFCSPPFFIATTDKTQIKLSASYPQSNKKQANHS